jgi:hypothetical protein
VKAAGALHRYCQSGKTLAKSELHRLVAATADIDPTRTLASIGISYCSSDARFSPYQSTGRTVF